MNNIPKAHEDRIKTMKLQMKCNREGPDKELYFLRQERMQQRQELDQIILSDRTRKGIYSRMSEARKSFTKSWER